MAERAAYSPRQSGGMQDIEAPSMAAPKIYADFHNLDDSNQVRLTCAGTLADLSRQGIELREGLRLTLYMDDADDGGQPDELPAEGIAHYCPQEHVWVASVDWDTVRHASEEKKTPNRKMDSA